MRSEDIENIIRSLMSLHNKIDNIENLISSAMPAEYGKSEEVHEIWRSIILKAR